MVIPPNVAVINKSILYSDTVLPLKDLGNNLNVCSISNVSEYSLDRCLKIIFESNPDVVFNTIQYSESREKVYFYTDKLISTKAWDESKVFKYHPLSNSKEILDEIERLFREEDSKDAECISLYNVSNLFKKYNDEYDNIIKKYCYYFERVLCKEYCDSDIIVDGFDYKNKEMTISIDLFDRFDFKKMVFSKDNGDLYVSKSESVYSQEILALIGKGLSELYDELIKYSDYFDQCVYNNRTFNSNFLFDVSSHGVRVYVGLSYFSREFELSSLSYKNDYDYKCNSLKVLELLQDREDELFKKIFVRIDDCPKWSRQILYQIRQEQLTKEQKLIEEKRQKRLNLKRILFPWSNK